MQISIFNATLDFPICAAYKELLRRYPDAKVILTLRDSGEKWAKSFLETIGLNTAWMLKPPSRKRSAIGAPA